MADFPKRDYNLKQLLLDASKRWLKPAEICEILFNHHQLTLSEAAPVKPPNGSLFLFDRNKLRYFRKDGHNWRKKKDGRTVREAHEKLKAGNKEAVHCYYAHGEDNPNFQRRSYWLLEGGYENIVLVHYREVTEGYRLEVSPQMFEGKSGQGFQNMQSTEMMYGDTDYIISGFNSSPSEVISSSHDSQEVLFDLDSGESFQESVLENKLGLDSATGADYAPSPISQGGNTMTHTMLSNIAVNDASQYQDGLQFQAAARRDLCLPSASTKEGLPWSKLLESTYKVTDNSVDWGGFPQSQQSEALQNLNLKSTEGPYNNQLVSSNSSGHYLGQNITSNDSWSFDVEKQPDANSAIALKQESTKSGELYTYANAVPRNPPEGNQEVRTANNGLLSPTVSFIMQSIHTDDAGSTLGTCWGNTGEAQYAAFSGSSFPEQTSLYTAPELLLNIVKFAPNWSYDFGKTQILVVGVFLDSVKNISNKSWACKFGDVEVPADILQPGIFCCTAPPHKPGKVSFCITCSDGVSCSNMKDFEFRETSPIESPTVTKTSELLDQTNQEEQAMLHQIRLAKFLLSEDTSSSSQEFVNDAVVTPKENEKRELLVVDEIYWTQLESFVKNDKHPYEHTKAMMEQAFFKSALLKWLERKSRGENISVLDRHGLGILHRAAALGYEWAISPLLEAGVGVNFRDERGWTALHWAAFCGREKVIGQLLAADAHPGALTDPTPSDPTGRTASDLAASSGHDGIAGYLGEAIVTSHFTSLNLSEMRKLSMALAQNQGIEVMSERSKVVDESFGVTDDDLSLRDSLAAVRNAAQAEACIAATFRAYSFQRKREKETNLLNDLGILEEDSCVLAAAQKIYRGNCEKSNLAATQIQCKYRGWKARSDYLCLKKHVVKIQAHVRGHQARKKYKKILWTVSILDKVILRWRRKGSGLRGYKHEELENDDSDDDTYLKDFRKQKEVAFGEAVGRVKQMIQSPDARSQYRRMLEIYQEEKGAQLDEDLVLFDEDELMGLLGH